MYGTPGRKVEFLAILLLLLIPLAPSAPAADGSASLTISGTILADTGISADFTGAPRSGDAPLTVQFTDRSPGNPTTWAWDLDGDGIVDSDAQNPPFVYHRPGSYTVILTVSNAATSDVETKPEYITVSEPGALTRVQALQGYIATLPVDGWVKWFLSLHLEITEKLILRKNYRAASAELQVFSSRVTLFERFRLISGEQAGFMRAEAGIIRELIPR